MSSVNSVVKSPAGFSLVEMMVVLVLIGLLASVVTINVRSYLIRGRQNTAKLELSTLRNAVETYYGIMGRYPTNEEGLGALAQTNDQITEPLIDKVPVDPWGRPYQYLSPGRENRPYEIVCYGADGREGGTGADQDLNSSDLRAPASSSGTNGAGSATAP
ncbi:MAG: type II secretion system major pseudopilin GspG [Phycisphaeraceae bacterium]|nr:type II secretion system major pseudopilin GspG [Phycisphaeraceae bacterium]